MGLKSFKAVMGVLAFLGFVLIINGPAFALMVGRSVSELTNDAEAVIEGKVTSIKSEWSDIKSEWSDNLNAGIVTNVNIEVTDVIKGDLIVREEVVVQTLGGEILEQNIGLQVSDQPEFQVGEEVIIFLKKHQNRNVFRSVGNFQGKMKVVGGKVSYKNKKVKTGQFKDRIRNIIAGGLDIEQ